MIIIFGGLLGSIFVGILFAKDGKLRNSMVWGTGFVSTAMILYVVLTFPGSVSLLGCDTFLYFVLLSGVLFLLSISTAFIIVPIQAHIQKETPIEYMSRVFSMIGLMSRGGIPLGALIYGFSIERMALHSTMVLATMMTILASISIVVSMLKGQEV